MYPLAEALVGPMHAIGFTPNLVSALGLCVSAAIAYLIAIGSFYAAVALFAVHQVLDAADGTMARRYNMCSPFGAKLDQVCDMITGSTMSLAALYASWGNPGLVAFHVVTSGFLLFSALAYENRNKSIRYVEELSWLQHLGLFEEENQTYLISTLMAVTVIWLQ